MNLGKESALPPYSDVLPLRPGLALRGSVHVQGCRGKESHPSSTAREHQRLGHAELLSCHCRPVLLSPAGRVRPGCSSHLVPVLLWGCAGTAGRDRQWARQWHSWPPLQHFPPKGGSPPRWTEQSSSAQSAVRTQMRALQPHGTHKPQQRSLARDSLQPWGNGSDPLSWVCLPACPARPCRVSPCPEHHSPLALQSSTARWGWGWGWGRKGASPECLLGQFQASGCKHDLHCAQGAERPPAGMGLEHCLQGPSCPSTSHDWHRTGSCASERLGDQQVCHGLGGSPPDHFYLGRSWPKKGVFCRCGIISSMVPQKH